jgi:hypothetical protein
MLEIMVMFLSKFKMHPVSAPCWVMTSSIMDSSCREVARSTKSSTNIRHGILLCGGKLGIMRPVLLSSSFVISGFMYTMNRSGDRTEPCLRPFFKERGAEALFPIFILSVCFRNRLCMLCSRVP